jgi:predicted phosphoribosyltransferase
MIYRNRIEAGRVLAEHLRHFRDHPKAIVLALPRGGVPVGFEIASSLHLPFDVFLVRKLGTPGHSELAMGAIASGGVRVINNSVVNSMGVSQDEINAVAQREQQELERREHMYRGDRPPPDVRGRIVILVDDGLATGSTMRAAVEALRAEGAKEIVVAVPVASRETCDQIGNEVDSVVCGATPEPFYAVGQWYLDFSPTTDEEVRELLERSQKELPHAA